MNLTFIEVLKIFVGPMNYDYKLWTVELYFRVLWQNFTTTNSELLTHILHDDSFWIAGGLVIGLVVYAKIKSKLNPNTGLIHENV